MCQKGPAAKKGRVRTSKRTAFLAAYVKCGNVTLAARRAQVSRQQHYEWLKDPGYSRAFAKVQRELFDCQMAEMEQRIEKSRRGD